jgi:hypothetical protein
MIFQQGLLEVEVHLVRLAWANSGVTLQKVIRKAARAGAADGCLNP